MNPSHPLKEKIIVSLTSPLPGPTAHQAMAVPGRSVYAEIPPHAKKAAVLILFYHRIDRILISLIKRKHHEADRHSGQISFPGGKMEIKDDYPVQTAVREAKEEIGISENIEILGRLSPLYIPVSNFFVAPVIAWHREPNPVFNIQHDEVDELIEVDINFIMDASSKRKVTIPIMSNLTLMDVPAYEIHGQVIWGATAMMLSEVEWIIRN